MISSPLEQFELIPLIPLSIGSLDISFTQSTFFMCIGITAFLSLFRMILINGGGTIVPNRWQVFLEGIFQLCMSLSTDTIEGGKVKSIFHLSLLYFRLF